ncbi:MAG: hypothetical protein, partial [Olavius algarvensis Gamma 1 endosymbiont]
QKTTPVQGRQPLPAHRPLHARPERRKPQPPCQG